MKILAGFILSAAVCGITGDLAYGIATAASLWLIYLFTHENKPN